MDNNINKNNLSKRELSKNIQILTVVINNNLYNFNDFNLNNILLPFLIHANKPNYYNPQKNAFIFPEGIDVDSLQLFCTFLLKPEKINISNYIYLKKILNVCAFFNAKEIINNISERYIAPKIDKDNCLDIVIHFFDFIHIENETIRNIFIKIINKSLVLISQNLIYLLNNKQNKLYSLNNQTIEEIVELFLKNINDKKMSKEDIENIIDLLIHSRKISDDVFLLLENERKKAINNFESLFNEEKKNNIEPTFIWKISSKDIKKQYYQEKLINLDNLDILLISYYDDLNDSFQLAIQILDFKNNNNVDDNINFVTENDKGDILMDTSTAKKINNNNEDILSTKNRKKEEKKEGILTNILSLCEIDEINYKSHINFNGIYTKNNSRFLVCKIDNFKNKFKKTIIEFSLKIYFSRNYIFPKIIEHICQNFDKYYNYPSISKLPRSAMNILLKNEIIPNEFNDNCENYKLYAIENWINSKNAIKSKKYIDIFKTIDWKKIDNDKLIDFFMKNAKLIYKENSLKNDIFFEIQRRFEEEYSSYFMNNKTYNSKSISLSNYEDIKLEGKSDYSSFTYEFLSKIIYNLISYNNSNNNNEISEYSTNGDYSKDITTYILPNQEEDGSISQRDYLSKNNISKNIMINNSLINNNKKNIRYKKEENQKKINIKNMINNNKINYKFNNSNIPSNRNKKSSNNSLSSFQINNLSEASGVEANSGNSNVYNNKITNNKKNLVKKNYLKNNGIKSFTPSNSKGKFIIKEIDNKENENKYHRTISLRPSKIQFKKMHSRSVDKIMMLSGEISDKKIELFPKEKSHSKIKNSLNDIKSNHKIIQIKKKFQMKDNISKIPYNDNNADTKHNIFKTDKMFNKIDKISYYKCKSTSKKVKNNN